MLKKGECFLTNSLGILKLVMMWLKRRRVETASSFEYVGIALAQSVKYFMATIP